MSHLIPNETNFLIRYDNEADNKLTEMYINHEFKYD